MTTTGSKTSNWRVTRVCSAVTISAATAIGSCARCGRRRVPAGADDLDVQDVGRRHHRAGADGDRPARERRRCHVHEERGIGTGACRVEHAGLDHVPGAVVALFAGLEHEDDVAAELVAMGAEQARRPHQHRNVQVVAAGMHGAVASPAKSSPVSSTTGSASMSARSSTAPARPSAPQHADDRRQARTAGRHLERQAVQSGEHLRLRARQLQTDLRIGVQGSPECDEIVLLGPRVIEQIHRRSLSGPTPADPAVRPDQY